MATVKVLLAGSDNFHTATKGDVIEVVPSVSDWGNATVTPDWVRLNITDVPGTQQQAEDTVRAYLQSWQGAFEYTEVPGAANGQQRYRVEASPEIANDFDLSGKLEIRDRILTRFNGTLANQSATHFEFDTYPGLPLDEMAFEISQIAYRRFRFPENMVNNAVALVSSGQPVTVNRTRTFVLNNIIDKMRS